MGDDLCVQRAPSAVRKPERSMRISFAMISPATEGRVERLAGVTLPGRVSGGAMEAMGVRGGSVE